MGHVPTRDRSSPAHALYAYVHGVYVYRTMVASQNVYNKLTGNCRNYPSVFLDILYLLRVFFLYIFFILFYRSRLECNFSFFSRLFIFTIIVLLTSGVIAKKNQITDICTAAI